MSPRYLQALFGGRKVSLDQAFAAARLMRADLVMATGNSATRAQAEHRPRLDAARRRLAKL